MLCSCWAVPSTSLFPCTFEAQSEDEEYGDSADPLTLSQMLHDGMDDAMEALETGDDGGGWHRGRASSCDEDSSDDEQKVERFGRGLEDHTWPPKMLSKLHKEGGENIVEKFSVVVLVLGHGI